MNIKIEYLCDKPLLTLCQTKNNIELPINWYHWGSYIFVEHNDIEYALVKNEDFCPSIKKKPNLSVNLNYNDIHNLGEFKCNHCNSPIEFERIRCGHLFGMDYINCGSCAKSFCIKNIEKNNDYFKKCFNECLNSKTSQNSIDLIQCIKKLNPNKRDLKISKSI